jgi:hypothetical protein
VFEYDNRQHAIEGAIPEWEFLEVGNRVQFRVVPAGIALCKIDSDVRSVLKENFEPALASAGVENSGTRSRFGCNVLNKVAD